jgi:hypothetical protein
LGRTIGMTAEAMRIHGTSKEQCRESPTERAVRRVRLAPELGREQAELLLDVLDRDLRERWGRERPGVEGAHAERRERGPTGGGMRNRVPGSSVRLNGRTGPGLAFCVGGGHVVGGWLLL